MRLLNRIGSRPIGINHSRMSKHHVWTFWQEPETKMKCVKKLATFSIHSLYKIGIVQLALKFFLQAETSNICNFLHVGEILILIIHSPADGALCTGKSDGEDV